MTQGTAKPANSTQLPMARPVTRVTKAGAFAGVISGLLTVGGATLVISLTSSFSNAASKSPEMGVCAMAISMIVVPVVSLLTQKKVKDKERVEEIFSCYKEY